ncbi:MAG: hypothetical protein ACYSUY_17120 [Planctomycetota bacterium]|jgi:hypothetical protein
MSQTLWAVIIGGILGGGFSLVVLIFEHLRWKKEFKIQYLQAAELLPACWIRLPKKVSERITEVWQLIDHSQKQGQLDLFQKVLIILGEYMSEIDEQIEKLSGIALPKKKILNS